MKIQNVNMVLRNMFSTMMTDENVKKRHICSLILGTQCEPQFDGFINGRDFGIKPLEKIAENLGYDIELVFIKKPAKSDSNQNILESIENTEEIESVNKLNQDFVTKATEKIKNGLNNPDFIRTGVVVEPGAIQNVADSLFASIING